MKRPKSHQIDTKAQRILDSKLPTNWVKQTKHPDYGVDYEIEVFDDEEPTGIWFTIQLKGTEKLKEDDNYISFPLRTSMIEYYFSKVPLPIFLFIISVKESKIYWIFIQRYVNEVLNSENPNWTKQRNATIKIPKKIYSTMNLFPRLNRKQGMVENIPIYYNVVHLHGNFL